MQIGKSDAQRGQNLQFCDVIKANQPKKTQKGIFKYLSLSIFISIN